MQATPIRVCRAYANTDVAYRRPLPRRLLKHVQWLSDSEPSLRASIDVWPLGESSIYFRDLTERRPTPLDSHRLNNQRPDSHNHRAPLHALYHLFN